MNFETATLDVLAYHNYNIEDIDWIGCREFCVDIQDFFKAASKSEYDPGYGRPEMPFDLIIMMKDGSWFERREYDGSEWWQYTNRPTKPTHQLSITSDNFVYRGVFEPQYWESRLIEFCREKSYEMS